MGARVYPVLIPKELLGLCWAQSDLLDLFGSKSRSIRPDLYVHVLFIIDLEWNECIMCD